MSQENKKPLPSAAGNTSCSYKQEGEEDNNNNNNNIINGQMVPFVASSSAMELFESHKAYYNVKYNDVKYMECLKNHAAAMGGSATDGCGEFMAAGEDGSLEALKCSACQCHRNFHRKVVIKEDTCTFIFPSQNKAATPYNNNNGSSVSDSDEKDDGQHAAATAMPPSAEGLETKKRFRTKFTPEQKEKMVAFAERAGWKIQKVDSFVVQQFCQEIGVKRRVLKVWMHNNKNTFAKKITTPPTTMHLHSNME